MKILLAAALTGALIVIAWTINTAPRVSQPASSRSEPTEETAIRELPPLTNEEGPVKVIATGRLLPDRSEFELTLDTHSVELTEDLIATSVIVGSDGKEYRPRTWVGDPASGHHRSGILVFDPIIPSDPTIELLISGVGGVPKRTFRWTLL